MSVVFVQIHDLVLSKFQELYARTVSNRDLYKPSSEDGALISILDFQVALMDKCRKSVKKNRAARGRKIITSFRTKIIPDGVTNADADMVPKLLGIQVVRVT